MRRCLTTQTPRRGRNNCSWLGNIANKIGDSEDWSLLFGRRPRKLINSHWTPRRALIVLTIHIAKEFVFLSVVFYGV